MKRAICPSCEKVNGIRLLWGEPDSQAIFDTERGEIKLGGRITTNAALDRHCRSCGHQWESVLFPQNVRTEKSAAMAELGKKTSSSQAAPVQRAKRKKSGRRVKSTPKPAESLALQKSATAMSSTPAPVYKPSWEPVKPDKHVSFKPTIFVFIAVLLLFLVIAGPARCFDGWASGLIGRSGACSHHGGVNGFFRGLAFFFSLITAVYFHYHRVLKAHRS
jgi:hypothetical protein